MFWPHLSLARAGADSRILGAGLQQGIVGVGSWAHRMQCLNAAELADTFNSCDPGIVLKGCWHSQVVHGLPVAGSLSVENTMK